VISRRREDELIRRYRERFWPAFFFQTGTQGLDIIIDDGWLNENQQLIPGIIPRLILEEVPQIREVHQVGDAANIFGRLILDQSAENDCRAAGNRHRGRQTLAINNRGLSPDILTLLPRVSLICAISWSLHYWH